MEDLQQWLKEGKAKFPDLYHINYGSDYRGIHAKRDIPKDTVIITIPLSHIMTTDLAKDSEVGRKIIESKCQLRSSHSYLAAYLLQEKHNPDSYWTPYLNILPKEYKNMPIYFEEELKLLKGSFSLIKIKERKQQLRREYDLICDHVPDFKDFTYDEFVWARQAVITRIFGLNIREKKTDGLVPMADMLNHKRPNETAWSFDNELNAFTITSVTDVDKDSQIFNSYGRKCNSRFFVNYGFSLEVNDDNQAMMQLEIPTDDPFFQLKMRFLEIPRKKVQIPAEYREKVTREAFSFLRLAHARDSEIILLGAAYGLSVKNVQPISIENELACLVALANAAQKVMKNFETTIEEDNEILLDQETKLTMNERNAILMRRGEKKVLQYYIDLPSRVEPLVDMPWPDVQTHVKSDPQWAVEDPSTKKFLETYFKNVITPLWSDLDSVLNGEDEPINPIGSNVFTTTSRTGRIDAKAVDRKKK